MFIILFSEVICRLCRVLVLSLPIEARRSMCSIRWWQPVHSGQGRDVWALDDITVADSIHNMLWIDFSDYRSPQHMVNIHHGNIGTHCGRPNVLV